MSSSGNGKRAAIAYQLPLELRHGRELHAERSRGFVTLGRSEPGYRSYENLVDLTQHLIAAIDGPRFGTPVTIMPRFGQGAFRVLVTDAYASRCAMTGERTLPALEAAHICPFADGGRTSFGTESCGEAICTGCLTSDTSP